MGLGPLDAVSLSRARELALECRQLRATGIDPIEQRNAQRAEAQIAAARSTTFDQCRDAFLDSHKVGWRNAKHRQQWLSTLSTYVSPVFGAVPVQSIDTALVMKVLQPLWAEKNETGSRVRGRIESILDWAKVSGLRMGENPARWRGHLAFLLPARSKVHTVRHFSALDYRSVGQFMLELRQRKATAARALELLILTGARTETVIGARWEQIDIDEQVWNIPGHRMKSGRDHRVPLSLEALRVLQAQGPERDQGYIFSAANRSDRSISNMAMLTLLKKRMGYDATPHGFRSCFKTWATEQTNFAREVVEAALAHVVGNKVEAAYQRGDLFEKRRRLMTAWGAYCSATPRSQVNILQLRTRSASGEQHGNASHRATTRTPSEGRVSKASRTKRSTSETVFGGS